MQGRNETLNSIVKGRPIPRPGTPESFKVLMRELQALCLDIAVYKVGVTEDTKLEDNEINLMEEFTGVTSSQQTNQNSQIDGTYINSDVAITPTFFMDSLKENN